MSGNKFDFAELEINLKQCHIDKGQRAECTRCPGALALLEQVQDIESIDVDDVRVVFFTPMGKRVRVETPVELQKFIIDFDDGKPVQPFTFKIQNPLL